MRRRRFLASSAALFASPAVTATGADTATFGLLGGVRIDQARDAVLGAGGETAYVAANDGFATVDVNDPTTPETLTEVKPISPAGEDDYLGRIWDLAVDGDRLVVAGPASGNAPLKGFVLYDVSDPAAPEELAFFETSYPIHNIAFSDGVAYLTGNNRNEKSLVAVDCGDDDPREAGRWSLVDYDERWSEVEPFVMTLHDIYVQDGTAYLAYWDAGTWMVDVSDPTAMSGIIQVRGRSRESLADMSRVEAGKDYGQLPGNDHYVAVDDDASVLAVGAEAWDNDVSDDRDGGPGGVELYDISTPTEPTRLASIEAPETPDPTRSGTWTTSHNFDFAGGRLYTSWYQGGLTVHDLSDPANPNEIASWEDPERLMFFTAQVDPDEEFVIASSLGHPGRALGIETGLYVFPAIDANGQPTLSGGQLPSVTDPTTTTSVGPSETTTTVQTTTTATPPTPPGTTTTALSDPTTAGTTNDITSTPDDTETPSGSGFGPGFGVLSALAGLAAGGAALKRRSEE